MRYKWKLRVRLGLGFKKKDAYTNLFGWYKLQKKKDAYTTLFGRYKLK